jgi:hypothetical protein
MAKLDINSKLKMNSGYDIPILGYGVSNHSICSNEELGTGFDDILNFQELHHGLKLLHRFTRHQLQ